MKKEKKKIKLKEKLCMSVQLPLNVSFRNACCMAEDTRWGVFRQLTLVVVVVGLVVVVVL